MASSKKKNKRVSTHKGCRFQGQINEDIPYATRDTMNVGRRNWGEGRSPDCSNLPIQNED